MSEPAGALPQSNNQSNALAELFAQRQQLREGLSATRARAGRLGGALTRIGGFALDDLEPDADHDLDLDALEGEVGRLSERASALDEQLASERQKLAGAGERLDAEELWRKQRRTARRGLFLLLVAITLTGALRLLSAGS